MIQKEILKSYGENTAYSAKCHFKSADILKNISILLILFTVIITVVNLSCEIENKIFLKIVNIVTGILTFITLIYDINGYRDHKEIAENYLSLHYKIKNVYNKNKVSRNASVMGGKKSRR